jgi:putative ubiquitin-RnfH superfamily antitoxin RatB of RatAB toxin-antitoxin module
MALEATIAIEVVYALPEEQIVVPLSVPSGSTVALVLERSGLLKRFPVLADASHIGIYGRVVARETPVKEGDRIEIYRPLIADPKEARRLRAGRSTKR